MPSAPSSTPVSVHEFHESESKATRIIGGAPAGPRSQEEFMSSGTPSMTGVPGLVALRRGDMQAFLLLLQNNCLRSNRGERFTNVQ
jgi:hypothetical protein